MTSPQTLMKGWQIPPKKQLGQHFLRDIAMARIIAESARIQPNETVLEIGAGLGALTIPIAQKARHVFAVETDKRITGLLKTELDTSGADNVDVIEADFLRFRMADLPTKPNTRLVVMGNLPYNISSQVLIKLILSRQHIDRAVLMFQKELANRLMATPGTKAYGRITVMLSYCATIARLVTIPSESFYPRPKVDSTVLHIQFIHPLVNVPRDEAYFTRVVKAGFSQRRKTLKNALAGGLRELTKTDITRVLSAAGIDPTRRAETLSPEEFIRLSDCLLSVDRLAG